MRFFRKFSHIRVSLVFTLSRLIVFMVESRLKGANPSLHVVFSLIQRVRFFGKFSHIRVSLVFTLSRLIVFIVGSRLKGTNPSLHVVFSLVQRARFFRKLSHKRVSWASKALHPYCSIHELRHFSITGGQFTFFIFIDWLFPNCFMCYNCLDHGTLLSSIQLLLIHIRFRAFRLS